MKEINLDETDRRILCILQREGRLPNAHLAEKVGLSPPSVLERVRKLEKRGIIRGYTALVDEEKVGMKATVFVHVTLSQHSAESIANFHEVVMAMPEVLECHHVTGGDDYLLKVVIPDISSYEDFLLHRLTRFEGVSKVKSSFVLSTLKRQTSLHMLEEGCED